MLEYILQERLKNQQGKNLYRKRRVLLHAAENSETIYNNKTYINFCSNDYLGLANHPAVIKAFKKGAEHYGVGSGASQLITGYSYAHQALEEAFAEFLQRDRALLFSNGYMANIGVLQALARKDDVIYQDKLNHASLIDAGLITKATLKRYQHNDMQQLQHLLAQQTKGHRFIITDSLFSMNGDLAPMAELITTARNHNAWLMVDDAHGIGVLGKNGRGIIEHLQLTQTDIPILVCPLGKAFGCFGAVVAGSNALIENLIQFARTYTYTTAIPPALAVAAKTSLEIVKNEVWRRERLQDLILYFKQGALQRGLKFIPSDSPIQSFIVGNAAQTVCLSEQLSAQGFLISAIRPPTVPFNTARLRITLSCQHQEAQIEQLLDCLMKSYAALL